MRDTLKVYLLKLKEFAVGNPRIAFIGGLVVIVGFTSLVASALPNRNVGYVPEDAYVQKYQEPKGTGTQNTPASPVVEQSNIPTPIANGEITAESFAANQAGELTLGGILPMTEGIKIETKQSKYAWGGSGVSRDSVENASATVTFPLGGRFIRLDGKLGFLTTDSDVSPGGKYEVFIDGSKVWEKVLSAEAAAMGKAADVPLSFDLKGKNALTLRITSLTYKKTSGLKDFNATVPYPVIFYDMDFVEVEEAETEKEG